MGTNPLSTSTPNRVLFQRSRLLLREVGRTCRDVTDMPDRRLHNEVTPQVAIDGLRLSWRLDDDELLCHDFLIRNGSGVQTYVSLATLSRGATA